MNKLLTAIAALGLIGTTAFAADLAVPPTVAVVTPWSWTGFYLGGDIGVKTMHNKWTATSLYDGVGPTPAFPANPIDGSSPRIYDLASFRAGGYVGYNWQFSPTWLGGIEGDAAWANDSQTQAGLPGCAVAPLCVGGGAVVTPNGLPFGGDTASVKMLWDASARVRLGYLVTPDLLLYGTGGAAWQNIEVSGRCGSPVVSSAYCLTLTGSPAFPGVTQSTTLVGWTVGVGLEHHVWGNWLLRAEYRFADFGSWNSNFAFLPPAPAVGNNTYRFSNSVYTNTFNVGLGHKF
jgi:outer membrane immunogenic protein